MTAPPPPLVVASQAALALLMLAFAWLALAVARRTPPPLAQPEHRAAWRLTGAAFSVAGAHALLGSAAAAWVLAGPPGGALHDALLRWSTGGEPARLPVLLAYGGALLLLAAGGGLRLRHTPAAAWAGLLLCLAAGVAAAWRAGGPPPGGARAALVPGVANAAVVVVLLAALLAALLRDAVDQLLWTALVVFALRAAVDAGLPLLGWWSDPFPLVPVLTSASLAVMVALAARRLALARRGARVPALLEPLWPRRVRPAP